MPHRHLLVDGIFIPEKEAVRLGKIQKEKKEENLRKKGVRKTTHLTVEKGGIVKKVVIYFSLFAGLFLVSALSAPYIFEYSQRGKVLPGIYVLGENVGGKSEGELRQDVREKLENNKFVFKVGDREKTAEFYEMGLGIDYIRLSDKAFLSGREENLFKNFKVRYRAMAYWLSPKYSEKYLSKVGIEIDYGIDEEKLNKFVSELSALMEVSGKNAGLVVKGTDIEVIPAQYGEKIIADSLGGQIRQSITKLRDGEKMVLGIMTEKVMPLIREQGLLDAIKGAKTIVKADISFVYNDKTYEASKEEVASWIVFEENGASLRPKLDRKKVEAYLQGVAKEIDVPAQPKRIRVENGTKELVQEEGKDGLEVDVAKNTDLFIKAAENGESAVFGILTKVVKASVKTERVLIADWAKYIDIDLKTQRMTAYENKTSVFSDAITSGKNGTATPTGTFLVYGKTRSQTMKGGKPGTSDYYYLPNVQFITWFNGAIAVHQAYWRKSFGGADYVWNGSHGCINATLGTAEFIYNWAPVGTPVVVHY